MSMEQEQPIIITDSSCYLSFVSSLKQQTDLSKEEQMNRRLFNLVNPYCFQCGDLLVRVIYLDTSDTLENRLIQYFSLLKRSDHL